MSEKLYTGHEAENLFLDAYVLPGELAKDRDLATRLGRPPHVPFATDDNGKVGYRMEDLWAAVRAARGY